MSDMKFPEKCKVVEVPVPPMPGPFVNAPLMSVGCDKNGCEKFWASTFNSLSGTIGMTVDEKGREKRYDFDSSIDGLYGAAVQDNNTLWFCGNLEKVIKLNLKNGKYESFKTGLQPYLAFSGMVFDKNTGKLFTCAANDNKPAGFSFDTETKEAKHFFNKWKGRYIRQSFPNGDGTWSIMLHCPQQLIRWDPETDSITHSGIDFSKVDEKHTYKFIYDQRWGYYIPDIGWYDAVEDCVTGVDMFPEREMLWFGLHNGRALGCRGAGENLQVAAWHLKSGKVTNLFSIPDSQLCGCCLTKKGDVAAMSIYGDFRIYDTSEAALKLAIHTASESVCHANNLTLFNKDKLVGTTFINQRFWISDIKEEKSEDCGRAAPGTGQITGVDQVGKKIYMTAYHGGELVELDPEKPASFPINPRPVTSHPDAMRPVAFTSYRNVIWYACSRHYGLHGSVLFRYDTKSGTTSWKINPLGPRSINCLSYNSNSKELICGSTVNADQGSADRKVHNAVVARLDSATLAVNEMKKADGINISILGKLDKKSLLCADYTDTSFCIKVLDEMTLTEINTELPEIIAAGQVHPGRFKYAGKPGEFYIPTGGRLEYHDLSKKESLKKILVENFKDDTWRISDGHLLLLEGDKVRVIYDIVKKAMSIK
ncbi:MAG: hypothetical protein ACYTFY_10455 [Planctomycetota bacterium]